jgi:hypothetical protein
MKGTIIGSDLLEFNNSVKILEINTNTTIFNSAVDLLDYTIFFEMLVNNNINELHFIYNEFEALLADTDVYTFLFEERLKTKCTENSITYFSYKVPKNSITVPYIEDADNKFILRQAYDTTALVDETYCADKFEFFNLMKDSEYIPKTYISDGTELSFDTFDTISNYANGRPNLVKKDRNPSYDTNLYPAIFKLNTDIELNELKTSVNNTTFLIQEFIYDDANIINNRWNVVRSIDIIYGSELDILNMGSYQTSVQVDVDFCEDEYESNGTQLTKKSRYKWVNKTIPSLLEFNYHADSDSLILGTDGNLISLNDLHVGDSIQSIDWTNSEGISPSNADADALRTPPRRWHSTIAEANSTLTTLPTDIVTIKSDLISQLFIKITLDDGTNWNELPDTSFFIQTATSDDAYFDKLNTCVIGDKLIVYNKVTTEMITKTITGLDVVYDEVTAYDIDVEPSDLFLVNIDSELFAIQHNFACGWCGWYPCGGYNCQTQCPECAGGQNKDQP